MGSGFLESGNDGRSQRGGTMSRPVATSGSVTLFLDAILSGHPGWQLAIERGSQEFVDPATLALLAKAHGCQLGVLDAKAAGANHTSPARLTTTQPAMEGVLLVCSTQALRHAESLLRQLPWQAAVFVFQTDESASDDLKKLATAGFQPVDSISVPHGAAFWLRSAKRTQFVPSTLARAFARCLHHGGGMGISQYFRVVAEILRHAPCEVLIFGAGADTALYAEANAGGQTVVVEHHDQWTDRIADLPCEVVKVQYSTTVQSGLLDEVQLPVGFSMEWLDRPWSVILVDSPEGHTEQMPGRQQSIFTASLAARQGAIVFVHDYNRALERSAAARYFGEPCEVVGEKPALAIFQGASAHDAAIRGKAGRRIASPATATPPNSPAAATVSSTLDVSVIIPTYNEGEWLKRTVESVLAAQTDLTFEIIVVDDASNDGSVDEVRHLPHVRVVSVGEQPVGCVVGRNLGAKASRGEYICFLDSHVLVEDRWLEYLRETAVQFQDRALVSGNILNVDHRGKPDVETQQYAYTLKAWSVESAWHFHGHAKKSEPYRAPLCPAGLMFTRRTYFAEIGGFSERIKKWGGTDVEISLKNYLYGGENIVDPRVCIYHYYKNTKDRKPTFSISYKQTFFNRLFIARAFGSEEVYRNAQLVLAKKAKIGDFVAEVESEENQRHIQQMRKRFIRQWDDFARDFQTELKQCFTPLDEKTG